MGRAPCCDKNGLKKGPWTPEEDQKLIDYINKHGYGSWRTLPKNAGLQRCGKSCRLRWTNYLRPDIKRGRFSFEEEETIIQLHSILGNKWSAIASRLPGRTDNEIKNYWNTHIRKRLLRMGIDPVTHSPRLDLLDLSSIFNSSLYNTHTNPSHFRMTRLLGLQPLVNPEILKLATSILSSSSRPTQQDPNTFSMQTDQIPSSSEIQQQLVQTSQLQTPLTTCTTSSPSPCVPFSSSCEAQALDSNFIQLYPSSNMFDTGFDAQSLENQTQGFSQLLNAWQRHGDTASTIAGHLPNLLDIDVINHDNYLTSYNGLQEYSDNSTFQSNNQSFSFSSVLSSPSSSPAPLNKTSNSNSNSYSTYITEDERMLLQQLCEV